MIQMRFLRLGALWLFISVCLFYTAWMTGFTFTFSECETLPNYAMLADGFANGHLYIQEAPPTDTILKNGQRYIFSGPVPALLRLPVRLVFGAAIPTGLMIVLLCAGAAVLFAFILDELLPADGSGIGSFPKRVFVTIFILNGISLHMVTIPSIHHESIVAAMFFLMMAVLFFLKACNRGYPPEFGPTAVIALALSLSVGCRFTYAYAAAFLFAVLAIAMCRNRLSTEKRKVVLCLAAAAAIGMTSLWLLLWYNYLRFGGFLDFGMAQLQSLYRDYFMNGGYFRYDHFPYNLWSLLFRAPQIGPEFPFINLPAYILQVRSIGLGSYFLINSNELTVSVFFLMPILLLCFMPCLSSKPLAKDAFAKVAVMAGLVGVQIFSVAFTVAAIARYYYDFIALLLLIGFAAVVQLRSKGDISNGLIIFLGSLSVLLSFTLPLNGIRFYAAFINYQSPLLPIFFRF